jgi:transcription elongation GreA/GreB family factor
MQLHKLKPNESRDSDGEPVYLTPEGIEKLQNELARLKARLPVAAEETARTAAYGDRSDNAEYKQAKGTLRRMHYRIFEIETQLKHAVAIKVDAKKAGVIQLGSTVYLEVNGKEKKFQIVGPDETDPPRGRISYLSPLGAALLKHKKDDVVEIKTAAGVQEYRILKIH